VDALKNDRKYNRSTLRIPERIVDVTEWAYIQTVLTSLFLLYSRYHFIVAALTLRWLPALSAGKAPGGGKRVPTMRARHERGESSWITGCPMALLPKEFSAVQHERHR